MADASALNTKRDRVADSGNAQSRRSAWGSESDVSLRGRSSRWFVGFRAAGAVRTLPLGMIDEPCVTDRSVEIGCRCGQDSWSVPVLPASIRARYSCRCISHHSRWWTEHSIWQDLTAVGARPDGRSRAGIGRGLTEHALTGAPGRQHRRSSGVLRVDRQESACRHPRRAPLLACPCRWASPPCSLGRWRWNARCGLLQPEHGCSNSRHRRGRPGRGAPHEIRRYGACRCRSIYRSVAYRSGDL